MRRVDNMMELEKKLLLTKEEYDRLLRCVNRPVEAFWQKNTYYDTDDLKLNRLGITCRIREKDGVYKATIKAHQSKNVDCSIENSVYVKNQYDDVLFKNMGVKYQGEMKTYRTVLFRDNDIEVVLDKNCYLGWVDYELEIEYKNGKSFFAEVLLFYYTSLIYSEKRTDMFRTMQRKKQESKSSRFLKHKKYLESKKYE